MAEEEAEEGSGSASTGIQPPGTPITPGSSSSGSSRFAKPDITSLANGFADVPPLVYAYDFEADVAAYEKETEAGLSLPAGEVNVTERKFPVETVEDRMPQLPSEALPYLRNLFQFWNSGWCELQSTPIIVAKVPLADDLKKLQYETNVHQDESTGSESPVPAAAAGSSWKGSRTEHTVDALSVSALNETTTFEQRMTARSAEGRTSLFRLVPRDFEQTEEAAMPQVIRRAATVSNLFEARSPISLLIEPQELSWELGDIEPMWCILTAYDIGARKRVSENFMFALHSPYCQGLLGTVSAQQQNNKGIFTFVPSPDVFLVLRIEKVLQGDLDELIEAYTVGSTCKEKARNKLKAIIEDVSTRLRPYRQPFAWSMADLPIATDDCANLPETITFSPIFRQKSDVSEEAILSQVTGASTRGTSTRKIKALRGRLVLGVRVLPPGGHFAKLLSSPAVQVVSSSMSTLVDPTDPQPPNVMYASSLIRVVQEFRTEQPFLPAMHYVNNLYVYPQSLNYGKAGTYQVRVFLLQSDEHPIIDAKTVVGLPAFYDPLTAAKNRSSQSTAIVYKGKSPSFYDEFKLELPPTLTAAHHLLFVVLRVQVKPPKKNQPSNPESPIGFAFLPLLKDAVFGGQEHELQLVADLPAQYLSLPSTALRLLNDGKATFRVRMQLVSSVFSHDRTLSKALNLLSPITANTTGTDRLKNRQSLSTLLEVEPLVLMRSFPVILNHCLSLIVTPSEGLALEAINTLCRLLSTLLQYTTDAHQILLSYVHYLLQPRDFGPQLHVHLASLWLEVLSEGNGNNDVLVQFAPFLLRVIFKSMVVAQVDAAKANGAAPAGVFNRRLFPASFQHVLHRLALQLVWEAQERSSSGVMLGKDVVYALGLFVSDLFSVIDRGFVVHLIHSVVLAIAPTNDQTLVDFKFGFLRTVSQYYRFWVQNNLPLPLRIASPEDLVQVSQGKSFLSSLLLQQISLASSQKGAVRLQAIATLRNLLYDHHGDPRYTDQYSRYRVSELYFPFLVLLSDRIVLYQDATHAEKRSVLISFLFILRNVPSELMRQWWSFETPARLQRFLGVLELCFTVFEYVGERRTTQLMGVDQGVQSSDNTKTALENMYSPTPSSSAASSSSSAASSSSSSAATAATSSGSTTSSGMLGLGSASPGGLARFRAHRSGAKAQTSERLGKPSRQTGYKFDELREMHLSSECAFILLDVLETFIDYCAEDLLLKQAPSYELLSKIFHLYSLFLKLDQSTEFLMHFHRSLRALIRKFSEVVFLSKSSTFVAELIPILITHCNSPVLAIRSEATAAVFLLMSTNFNVKKGNLTRFGVQVTNAVALVTGDDTFLQRSLGAIAAHLNSTAQVSPIGHQRGAPTAAAASSSSGSVGVDAAFGTLAKELMARLDTILLNSRRINQHADDLEMKHDLMVRVAESYTTIPDLRIVWLEKLAKDHVKHQHWAEAAVVFVHMAALSAEYLWIKRQSLPPVPPSSDPDEDLIANEGLPSGIAALSKLVCASAAEERLPVDIVLRDTDSVCESPVFGTEGLRSTLVQAIKRFHKATLWESVHKICKVLLPIYEYNRQFKEMASTFADLKQSFAKIAADEEARTRTLGQFYRVVFIGDVFGKESGREYVYKTPLLTRLGEVKERLENINRARYGADKIEVWPRNEPIPVDKQVAGKGWIQITNVRPYFDEEELQTNRVTYYEQSTDINRFIYETAFTKLENDGKAQRHAESLADQWKRRIIITTEKSFPYLKTRLAVVSSQSIELSPIQGAIDTIEQQTREMLAEINAKPHNVKNLQRILQGSLLVQVQAGPKAIALAFFETPNPTLEIGLMDRLRQAFVSFLQACLEAKALNKLLAPDATVLQEELDLAYVGFEKLLKDLGIVTSNRRYTAIAIESLDAQ